MTHYCDFVAKACYRERRSLKTLGSWTLLLQRMAPRSFSFFALGLCSCWFSMTLAMEPLAPLSVQPAWQAAEPVAVNVNYDVPAFGYMDEVSELRQASALEFLAAKR